MAGRIPNGTGSAFASLFIPDRLGELLVEASSVPVCAQCGTELAAPYAFCGTCGAPSAAPAPHQPRATYLAPKKDNTLLVIGIILVLVVAVPTTLAAALYFVTSGLMSGPAASHPTVSLVESNATATEADILVVSAQPAVSPANLRADLKVGSSTGSPVPIPTPAGRTASLVVGTDTYSLTWENPGGSGTLVGGDHFILEFPAGIVIWPGTGMTFYLTWSDGSQIAQLSLTGPPSRPTVLFGSLTRPDNLTWSFLVAGVTLAVAPTDYRLNFAEGLAIGTPVGMGTDGQNVTIPGLNPTPGVKWSDVDGNALVSAGDVFTITLNAAPPAGATMIFYLLWPDGSTIGKMEWQT